MTSIVGIEHKGRVFIGGDSKGSNGYSQIVYAEPKVFRNGPFIMGYTTSFRMGQLLEHKFKPPKQDDKQSDMEYLTTTFVDAVRKCLKEGGYSKISDNQESAGTWLIGYRGNLYAVEDQFQVLRCKRGYMACGSGYLPALGSLYSTSKTRMTPKQRILLALKASHEFITSVGGPYIVLVSPKNT